MLGSCAWEGVICKAGDERAGPACCTGEVAVLTGVDDDEIIGAVADFSAWMIAIARNTRDHVPTTQSVERLHERQLQRAVSHVQLQRFEVDDFSRE